MQITFSPEAIGKLESMDALTSMAFTDTGVFQNNSLGNGKLCLVTNETDTIDYDHNINTNVGQVRVSEAATRKLGDFTTIDYDHFRNVFIVIIDGQIFDDNLYIIEK